jgi:hypothetical protein
MSTLRLSIVPSPCSNDHEVQCLVDGKDLVARLAGIGLDPDDFFGNAPRAASGEPAREYRIGRCDCGCVGCCDILAKVVREHGQIVWRVGTTEISFDEAQYDAELTRAASDHSWETPQRTAERMLRERLPTEHLRERGFIFEWVSGRQPGGQFTVAIRPAAGPYRQILLAVPWSDDLEQVVASALAALRSR